MEGLCPSKPPRQRPGAFGNRVFGVRFLCLYAVSSTMGFDKGPSICWSEHATDSETGAWYKYVMTISKHGSKQNNLIDATQAVQQRLYQMHQLWQQAADNYFFPEQFRLNLQNCVMVSRTVTFIMQSNKSSINDFDNWYQGYIEKWKSDLRNL
jgi:hypothetical protein